jgi:hypothetical protein
LLQWTTDAGGRDSGLTIRDSQTPLPPALDAPGYCGNQIIEAVQDRPNLYLVLDRSGSMLEALAGSSLSKYSNALGAIGNLLRTIGHRVNYAAAAFPGEPNPSGCEPGREVFSLRPGDPLSYGLSGANGPALTELLSQLQMLWPTDGGTPTSETLNALRPELVSLKGRTSVVLLTDGAPNCNSAARCTAEQCMPNLAGWCDPALNCCDPSSVPPGSQLFCVDGDAAEQAVLALSDAGIQTYVVGLPTSKNETTIEASALYTSVLDRLAIAGGTAKSTSPRYYRASDTTALGDALRAIGVEVAVRCDIALTAPPPDPTLVNVYLDTALLEADPIDGWSWTSATSVALRGKACERLLAGDVLQVQVVSGCPTVVR